MTDEIAAAEQRGYERGVRKSEERCLAQRAQFLTNGKPRGFNGARCVQAIEDCSDAIRALLATAPHEPLRIDDYRCATCGRLWSVCEAEWEAHKGENQ